MKFLVEIKDYEAADMALTTEDVETAVNDELDARGDDGTVIVTAYPES